MPLYHNRKHHADCQTLVRLANWPKKPRVGKLFTELNYVFGNGVVRKRVLVSGNGQMIFKS